MRYLIVVVAFSVAAAAFSPSAAEACPMCKTANETDNHRPRAYMHSILFMLAVPATIFTGLGIGLYRLGQREASELHATQFPASEFPPDDNEG